MQALEQTASKVLNQLIEERHTAAQLENGLQLLLQLQLQWPSTMRRQTATPACCLNAFLDAKVSSHTVTGTTCNLHLSISHQRPSASLP